MFTETNFLYGQMAKRTVVSGEGLVSNQIPVREIAITQSRMQGFEYLVCCHWSSGVVESGVVESGVPYTK
jgi:hypothetical protein